MFEYGANEYIDGCPAPMEEFSFSNTRSSNVYSIGKISMLSLSLIADGAAVYNTYLKSSTLTCVYNKLGWLGICV